MKKIIAIFLVFFCLLSICSVYAKNTQVIDKETESKLVEIKDKELKSIEDYTEAYGTESYGMTAYILNKIRIYSIPCCFIGIAVAAIYQFAIGIRRIDIRDRGLHLMIAFITILVICQILPLVFALVIFGWRG